MRVVKLISREDNYAKSFRLEKAIITFKGDHRFANV